MQNWTSAPTQILPPGKKTKTKNKQSLLAQSHAHNGNSSIQVLTTKPLASSWTPLFSTPPLLLQEILLALAFKNNSKPTHCPRPPLLHHSGPSHLPLSPGVQAHSPSQVSLLLPLPPGVCSLSAVTLLRHVPSRPCSPSDLAMLPIFLKVESHVLQMISQRHML